MNMTHNTPAPVADKALAERLVRLAELAQGDGSAFWRHAVALAEAHRSGQLITLAEVQAMVAAERERCAGIADAYADENITMAGDSVLHDPVLSGKRGKKLTRADFEKSEIMILDGCIHSSMFHAAQNIAAAIRAAATGTKEGV